MSGTTHHQVANPAATERPGDVIFAGGGTGGHLYPAIGIATQLRALHPEVNIRFFTTDREIDRHILEPTGFDMLPQSLPHVSLRPWRWARFVLAYRSAIRRALHSFVARRPSVVVGTGGFGSFPSVRAALKLGIPTALLNPDALPGRANRVLMRFVDRVYAQWPTDRLTKIAGTRLRVLGCPVRSTFLDEQARERAEAFGLHPRKKTLLVTGASLGARNVNRAFIANIDLILAREDWQVLHLTGKRDFDAVTELYERKVPPSEHDRFISMPFTHDMAAAIQRADLVISRAGASTLAELSACGKASVLLPYPYHRDMHQLANAECLAKSSLGKGAQIMIDAADDQKNAVDLRKALEPLLDDDASRVAMATVASQIGHRDAARTIAQSLQDLAGLTCPSESVTQDHVASDPALVGVDSA